MARQKVLFEKIDFFSDLNRLKYQGFLPLHTGHIMGLRYLSDIKLDLSLFQTHVLGEEGRKVCDPVRPGQCMAVLPAGVPHTVPGLYGYWHINEEDELLIPIPLANGDVVLVLLEGMPNAGRYDRFAQFCRRCNAKLYEKAVPTGEVGVAGFWKAEEDGVKEFNNDPKLRTCRNCGLANPHGYSFFVLQKGARDEREAQRKDIEDLARTNSFGCVETGGTRWFGDQHGQAADGASGARNARG
jgi:hypothetical protein